MAWQREPHDEVEQSGSSSGAFCLLVGLVVVLVGLCGLVFAVGALRTLGPGGPGPVRPPIVVTPAYNPTVAAATAAAAATATASGQH